MTELNTTNTEQLIYNNSLIKLTVLGGIKIEGLDRMRATLKQNYQVVQNHQYATT